MTYLILRFSSLGNVAMTVPVVTSLSTRYPNDQFVIVAKKRLNALFYGLPNVIFHEADFSSGGLKSLWRLFQELRTYSIDAVIDLQDVFRTHILCFLFRLQGKAIHIIDYGRAEKSAFIMPGHTHITPLKSEFKRYAQTLKSAGLETDDSFTAIPINTSARQEVIQHYGDKNMRWIGIAPFAKWDSNILPKHTIKQVIQNLIADGQTRIYLFGAGAIESEMLRQWAGVMPQVVSVAGELLLQQELELMRMLDCMIGMDSANQHLAALVNIRVVSIWCATHPDMGFAPWKQAEHDRIQTRISCRPCTIHGTGACRYHNFACKQISAEDIITCVNNK